jgi:carbon monoxide dehydrogenase subunit G
MDMNESQVLPVAQQTAWQALNDPDVLRRCIPGCESIERTAENEYALVMVAAIGPVKAKFQGKLQIEDPEPPRAYRLAFNGQGGAAGFGRGTAQVTLTPAAQDGAELEAGPFTRLDYVVHAQIGGKIAQIGSRLVDGAARKLATEFFAAFDALLRERYAGQLAQGDVVQADQGESGGPLGRAQAQGAMGTTEGVAPDPTTQPFSQPLSRDAAVGVVESAATSRSKRPWVWAAIVIVAALVIGYIMRNH